MMNSLVLKLIGGLAAVLMLVLLVADRNRWKGKAADRQAQLTEICTATRDASGNPKLDCKLVSKQIGLIGAALKLTTSTLDQQNAAVRQLGAATASQRERAAAAEKRATARARDADRTRAALEASARSGGAERQPCVPSEAVRESWR